uniref:Uncharacterized protein n=1 Tax=Aegilops tauschii subsp. strangulata TaxID=200361 RepID=A0A453RUI0_AEGTS
FGAILTGNRSGSSSLVCCGFDMILYLYCVTKPDNAWGWDLCFAFCFRGLLIIGLR